MKPTDIRTALEETGKARKKDWGTSYVTLEGGLFFVCWDGERKEPFNGIELFADDWIPYHPKPVIRPEMAGEVWDNKGVRYFLHWSNHTTDSSFLCLANEKESIADIDYVIHNQNGWTLLYSPDPKKRAMIKEDEDCWHGNKEGECPACDIEARKDAENVERIVIEDVRWENRGGIIYPYSLGSRVGWDEFVNKPPMTMTLTWPKDEK